MEQIKWTARKFTFGYDKGYTPFFLERLKATAPRLEELFSNTDEVNASKKAGEGWSAKEHLGHLSDLEILHDGRIDDFIAGAPILRAADMSNKATYAAEHNELSISYLLNHFREGRNNFIKRVQTLEDDYFKKVSLHPRLQQQVTITDILFFIAEHDNHHLLRIAEAL
ncbi:MAG: hypothetical protein K0Q79_1601 [Flavipsychrobacter sp.]|jgi:uncharacterized damage-inducible protein DinB|nr:hypothetical protein [Flavipsychrobacter sp.]